MPTLIVAADFNRELAPDDYGRAAAALAEAAELAGRPASGWRWSSRSRRRSAPASTPTLALVAQSGRRDVGVCLDLFHYYTGPSKFEDLAYLTPENLAWVQVCDLQRHPPRAGQRRRPDLARRGRLPDRPDPRPARRGSATTGMSRSRCSTRSSGRSPPTAWPTWVTRRLCRTLGAASGPSRAGRRDGRVLSVAVASFQPAAVVYREEQNFDWRVYALVAAGRGAGRR